MPIQKFKGPEGSDADGFVIVDIAAAGSADGIVRCAKKILTDGAWTMARSRTYAWALLGVARSGASAAINVAPTERHSGIDAFIEAVTPEVASGRLSLDAGKGVAPEELAPLTAVDRRSGLHRELLSGGTVADRMTALSASTAAATALDGLDGRSVAIEAAGSTASLGTALITSMAESGAKLVAVGTSTGTLADPAGLDPEATAASWREHGDSLPAAHGSDLAPQDVLSTSADVLFCGSRLGLVDHLAAASLGAKVLAPIGVAPVTARGLAVAGRAETIVLADFLTTSGALHSFTAAPDVAMDDLLGRVEQVSSELAAKALSHPEGAYLGSCASAEEFLSSWVGELPFGRPLA